jgi:cobalt-zinc-cadmium efflux system outer membrane protein
MQIRRDLAQAMRAFQVAQATVQQYETMILPKVGETLDLMQKAQEAGEFDFLRVLTARRAYFEANLKYVIAQTSLAQANARIEGLLLTGGLDQVASYDGSDELRGAALSGQ